MLLDRGVHRLLVLDASDRQVGLVSTNDLIRVLAYPEMTTPGTRP